MCASFALTCLCLVVQAENAEMYKADDVQIAISQSFETNLFTEFINVQLCNSCSDTAQCTSVKRDIHHMGIQVLCCDLLLSTHLARLMTAAAAGIPCSIEMERTFNQRG